MTKSAFKIYAETMTTYIRDHPGDAPTWKIPYKVFEMAYIREGYRAKTAFNAFCEIVKANNLDFDNHFLTIN